MTTPSDFNNLAGYLREPIEKNQDNIADLTFRVEELERVVATLCAWLLAKEKEV